MNKYYFPASGFGFWYQLGVLEKIYNEDIEIHGCSSGSIICLMSLLKDEDRKFTVVGEIADKIRKSRFSINIYYYLDELFKKELEVIKNYDEEFVKKRLSKINIEMCQVKFNYFIPYFKKIIGKPKNLQELRDFVISSCYVPFFSYHNNPFYFKINNSIYIDGFFASFSNNNNNFKKINSYRFSTLIPLNYEKAEELYNLGLNHKFENFNPNFNFTVFITIIINIIFDLLKWLMKKMASMIHQS